MLTKQPLREFVMGFPGRPGVPARTVCTPPYSPPPPPVTGIGGGGGGGSGGGGGDQVCTTGCMVVGTDPETGGPMYLCGVPVCRPG